MKNIIFILLLLLIVKVGVTQTPLINIDIGQQVPDVKIEPIYDAPFTSASLQELSKEKLVIIDFWATWCAPCVYAFPKLDSLAKEFEDQVQFILTTSQDKKVVDDFFNHRKEKGLFVPILPKVIRDTVLNKLFPHKIIPHYVWIWTGKVIAITEEVNRDEIQKALNGEQLTLLKKVDYTVAEYNRYRTPLLDFLNGNAEKKVSQRLETYSVLTRFIPELGYNGGYSSIRDYLYDKNMRITATNENLLSLYKVAYGRLKTFISDGTIDLQSTDSLLNRFNLSGMAAGALIEKRAHCYEIVASEDVIFEKMQFDLDVAFPQFKAEVVEVLDTCIVIEKFNNDIEKYVVDYDNYPKNKLDRDCMEKQNTLMSGLRTALEGFIFRYSKYPVVDHTGFEKRFNITLCGNLADLRILNEQMKPYGLKVSKKKVMHNKLLIRDR